MSSLPRAFARLVRPACVSFLLLASPAAEALARPAGDYRDVHGVSVHEVQPGDTLEGILRQMGFANELLVETILGFKAEFDADRLKPGQRIEVIWSKGPTRHPQRVSLTLGEETIVLDTSDTYAPLDPTDEAEIEWAERAVKVSVDDSVIAALKEAGAPERLGLDLAVSLGGLVDFRSEVQGGETVEVLYREEVVPEGEPAGEVELLYAKVLIGDRMLEVAREAAPGAPVQVFEDGRSLRRNASPVSGARLSSLYGQRKHPVLGTVRLHGGLDFAAKTGTPVHASAPGTIIRMGTNGGYGRMVEIRHGADLTTRYAHLSSFAPGLKVGQRVGAGRRIGAVGSTGLATGPHLHYEVRYNGRPVDPLKDDRIAALAGPAASRSPETVLNGLRVASALAIQAELASRAEPRS